MTKSNSIKQLIASLLSSHRIDGLTTTEIGVALRMPNFKLYQPLYHMKKNGVLSHQDGYYRLTADNKSGDESLPASATKPEAKVDYDGLLRQYMDLVQRVTESLENDSNFERKYYDALAVIKYLEGRRDGNA